MIARSLVLVTVVASLLGSVKAQSPTSSVVPEGDLTLDRLYVGIPVVGMAMNVEALVKNDAEQAVYANVRYGWGRPDASLDESSSLPLSGPIEVPPKGRVSFNFTWIPSTSQAGEGSVFARVEPVMARDPDASNDVRSVAVFVERYAIEVSMVEAPSARIEAWRVPEPGTEGHVQAVPVAFVVRNVGNVRDSANVSVGSAVEDGSTAGWMMNATQRHFSLDPSASVRTFALIRPPLNATEDTKPQAARVVVTSEGYRSRLPPERTDDESFQLRSSVFTPQVSFVNALQDNFSVSLGASRGTHHLASTRQAIISAEIVNTGQIRDVVNVTAEASTSWRGSARLVPIDADVNHSAVQVLLEPRERRSVRFSVQVDVVPLDLNGTIEFTATSVNTLRARAAAAIPVRASAPDLAVTSVTTTHAYRGNSSAIPIVGSNNGNEPASSVPVRARLLVNGQWTDLPTVPSTISAGPGEAWTATARLEPSALAGRYSLEVMTDPLRTFPDSDRSNDALVTDLFVHVPNALLRGPGPLTLTPGMMLRLGEGGPGFYVTNAGNARETFVLEVRSTRAALAASGSRTIEPGETVAIPIDINVPARVDMLQDELAATLRLEATGQALATAMVPLRFEVRMLPVIELHVPASANVDDVVTISANVIAAAPLSSVTANISFADGSSALAALIPVQGDEYQGSFAARIPGLATIVVHAADTAVPPNENASAPARMVVNTPRFAPAVVFDGVVDGDHLGAGRALRWRLEGAGTAQTSYSLDNAPSVEVGPPFEVSTDTWGDGRHSFTVHVTAGSGIRSSTTLSVVKKTTPPTIEHAAVLQDGAAYRVVAKASPDAAHATLLAPKGTRIPLAFQQGEFSAVFSAAAGDELTLSVADKAGNVAVAELVTPDERAIPTPSAAVIAAWLVAWVIVRKGHVVGRPRSH